MDEAYLVVWYPGRNNRDKGIVMWVCLDRRTAEDYAEKAVISLHADDKNIDGASWHSTAVTGGGIIHDYLYYYNKYGETKGKIYIENYPIAR